MRFRRRAASLILWPVALAGCVPADGGDVPLYDNLGTLTYPITAATPEVQRYFDQGLRLTYAFNHAEAIRAFEAAVALDSGCAMCYWGVALALGPNINLPMQADAVAPAAAAIDRARARSEPVSQKERDLIAALDARYASDSLPDRPRLDSVYAETMGRLARWYPEDDEIRVLHAEALMLLRPWNYWTPERTLQPGMDAMLAALEGVLARSPNHVGACHYYIHAVEAAYPERALPCAERLPSLMPGAGHIVHMPGHIFIRTGRYADAITANEHAVHADEAYIADQDPSGIYPVVYYPHNYHFLAFAALMAGRSRTAIEAARRVVENLPPETALEVPFLEGVPAYAQLALVSFGQWDSVLAEPLPAPNLRTATGLAYYARGVAYAAKGQAAEAAAARDSVRAIAEWSRETRGEGGASAVLAVARHALEGEIALRAGRPEVAIPHFQQATALEDWLPYDEPPPWYYPMRHSLGLALLAGGRAREAEAAYRRDLERFPQNGWSLLGLVRSLEAQGRDREAAEAQQQFEAAWSGADVRLPASRF
jgi:tetratricopeptide (TPR) repeat protein